jgi:hypothetical protein
MAPSFGLFNQPRRKSRENNSGFRFF